MKSCVTSSSSGPSGRVATVSDHKSVRLVLAVWSQWYWCCITLYSIDCHTVPHALLTFVIKGYILHRFEGHIKLTLEPSVGCVGRSRGLNSAWSTASFYSSIIHACPVRGPRFNPQACRKRHITVKKKKATIQVSAHTSSGSVEMLRRITGELWIHL